MPIIKSKWINNNICNGLKIVILWIHECNDQKIRNKFVLAYLIFSNILSLKINYLILILMNYQIKTDL